MPGPLLPDHVLRDWLVDFVMILSNVEWLNESAEPSRGSLRNSCLMLSCRDNIGGLHWDYTPSIWCLGRSSEFGCVHNSCVAFTLISCYIVVVLAWWWCVWMALWCIACLMVLCRFLIVLLRLDIVDMTSSWLIQLFLSRSCLWSFEYS